MDHSNSTMDGIMEQIPVFFTSLVSMLGANWAQYALVLVGGLFLGKTVKDTVQERSRKKRDASVAGTGDWNSSVVEVRKERDEAVEWADKESKLVDPGVKEKIEKMTFTELQEALQSGVVSAESVIRVYYGLAVNAHRTTNCLTGVIKEALTQAKKMDEDAKKPDYKKGPLWGIPLSVKDAVWVQGHRCTWGLINLINNRPKEDSYPIMKLRDDGMIPFVQTNVPTACLTSLTDNSIFGSTCNPHNSARTCGGSSGGEGALIGAMGSLVGLGNDIGGSIRIPASYSGCCGFKPSATRFSLLQLAEPIPRRPIQMPTEGPLAQDPHALVQILRSIWSDHFISNKDPFNVPVDFREDLFKEGKVYRIGYYTSDGYYDPLPGNQHVVLEAAELLKSKGHTLVPFSLGDIASVMAKGVYSTIYADGGASLAGSLDKEPELPDTIKPLQKFGHMGWIEKKARGLWYKLKGDTNIADYYLSMSPEGTDVAKGIDEVYKMRKRIIKQMNDEKIDLLLCPSTISPALPLALPTQLTTNFMFSTSFWNAMDFPAGVVPIRNWNQKDEYDLASYPEKGEIEKAIKAGCKNSVGLPLSVQIVAPQFRDESALRAMVDLFDANKKKQ